MYNIYIKTSQLKAPAIYRSTGLRGRVYIIQIHLNTYTYS